MDAQAKPSFSCMQIPNHWISHPEAQLLYDTCVPKIRGTQRKKNVNNINWSKLGMSLSDTYKHEKALNTFFQDSGIMSSGFPVM